MTRLTKADRERKERLARAAAKTSETRRVQLTFAQEFVLDAVVNVGTSVATKHLSEVLFDSDLNKWPGGGQRWQSRSEAANPHVAALVKKGYLERVERGLVIATEQGVQRHKELQG